jgi:hypothetical protein
MGIGEKMAGEENGKRAGAKLAQYPLIAALLGRRSRRFGRGMQITKGPFVYESAHSPQPLTEEEEALLVFAASGISGYALADLEYGKGEGGSMLAGLTGRTIASPDSVNAVSLVVTNDEATYLIKRPQAFSQEERAELIALARDGAYTELYRRSRIKILDGRAAPPVVPGENFDINKWSLYAKGGSYFLPVNSMTALYINVLLEAFEPSMGLMAFDERRWFRPAGVGKFARSKGGHLDDNPQDGRVFTIAALENSLKESVAVEQGMMLQNLGLMSQAMGIGGFPNYARHPYSWFKALDFRMTQASATLLFGGSYFLSRVLKLIGQQQLIPIPLGLERDGEVLLKPYCPPYYRSMEAAVHDFVDHKFGKDGIYRGGAAEGSDWKDPQAVDASAKQPDERAVAATVAYCEYIYDRYGSFPVFSAPYRTAIGYQATHVDVDFYDRFFKPEALTEAQRQHQAKWHNS